METKIYNQKTSDIKNAQIKLNEIKCLQNYC